MDYQMPEMDGPTTSLEIFKICKNYNLYNIVIIACSAFESKEEIQKCLGIGMKEFMKKPVTYLQIKRIIEKWM